MAPVAKLDSELTSEVPKIILTHFPNLREMDSKFWAQFQSGADAVYDTPEECREFCKS